MAALRPSDLVYNDVGCEVILSLSESKPRVRWPVIASGFLIAALGVVVMYTTRGAFLSPAAVVVVSAIGLAALLLQLRFRRDLPPTGQAPRWLNILGIVFALAALFGDLLHFSSQLIELTALAAVGCFAVSSVIVLDFLRKHRAVPK
jgi:uncharacterized membrane protein